MEASRPPNPALPYREDCWSEGETEALVEAWGDRFLDLNRGNLRQQHWQEAADAVNSRPGAAHSRRPPRTDVQCKNRVDTLKKKYKLEKARLAAHPDSPTPSQWPLFRRLDALIASSSPAPSAPKKPSASPSPPLALPLPYPHRKGSSLPAAAPLRPSDKRLSPALAVALPVGGSFLHKAAAAAAAAAADRDDDEVEESRSSSRSLSSRSGGRKRTRDKGDAGNGFRQLARAIERYTDIYERVEGAKQLQVMELEKQRMEFAKELEFQRMQIFVDAQVQLEKIKRAKRADASELIRSVAALPLLSNPLFV